ncbi:HAMP domain-containing histidine kinase [Methylobacterium planeticum]|uniref:histidine kinase n=2 Tax=Methylobacterium planeticum TaxID=2615211 RepID=A0A6N6MVH8_9HYPH|nr:HAMP domain-containing histidine kinase [Methylobacterium planeticum]
MSVEGPSLSISAGTAAESACAAMSRLLAVAGHDLKQPLHVAMWAIERALQRSRDPEVAARLDIAAGALHRLGSELDDLARSSQLLDGPSVTHRTMLLDPLLAELASHWQGYAKSYGITLRFRRSSLAVVSDPALLMTILRNLVGNAIKYSRRGGTVLVGCRRVGRQVAIEVHDRGDGIPASRLATMFDAFDRAGREHAQQPGLGLGLTIVRQTAQVLQHAITVRSREGVGSMFSVTVPRASQEGAG